MKKYVLSGAKSLFFSFLLTLISVSGWGQISITGSGSSNSYSQSFNTSTATVPAGWNFSESGGNSNSSFSTGTGGGSGGDTYFFGTSNEWAFGGLQSANLIPTIGASFKNETGAKIISVVISYKGETWRIGSANRSDRLDFQYSTDATSLTNGEWTDFNNLDYANPGQAIGSGSQQHSAIISSTISSLNISDNSTFWIRWNDFNASGADDGMAVDDFSIYVITEISCAEPTVALQTTPVQNISSSGADLYGDVTNAGGGTSVTQRGFQYSVNTNMSSAGTVQENAGTGIYNLSLNSLERNTKYFYRAFAINDCASPQTGYSSATPVSTYFVTKQVSTTSNAATNVETNSFTANWTNPSSGGGSETFTYKLVVERYDGTSWVAFNTYTEISSSQPYYNVTGASPNTLYRYYFYSVNEGGESDIPSNMTEVKTLSAISWANVQPVSPNPITEPASATVYARVFADGSTNVTPPDQGPGITAWIGYSTSNSDPSGSGWTWIPASFFGNDGVNNDEYSATLSGLSAGTYYYVSRFQVGTGAYVYGGVNNNIWTSTSDNGILTVNGNLIHGGELIPDTAVILEGNTTNIDVEFYASGLTDSPGQGGSPSFLPTVEIAVSTEDTDPSSWAAGLWQPAAYFGDNGNNDVYRLTTGSTLTPGKYYYAARVKKNGSTSYVYIGKAWTTWNNNNGELTVNNNVGWGNFQSPCTGSYSIGGTYNVYGRVWVDGITNVGGESPRIEAQVGYSSSNSDPSLGGFTWVDAQYNAKYGNNHEYMHNIGADIPSVGTYYMAFRYRVDEKSWYYAVRDSNCAPNDQGGTWNGTTNINASVEATAPSESSHVLVDTSFSYPQNIPYINYIDLTNPVSITNSVEVGKFIVTDGELSTGDSDTLPTKVTSLSFSIQNSSNIDKIALFDGTTKLGEVTAIPVNGAIGFGGLSLVVPDNSSKTLSLRILFKTTVTDNEQLRFSATLRTEETLGSSKFVLSDGTQQTSTDADNNRIEVTADRLAFTTQPSNTAINQPMNNVVVSATDINGNTDADISSGSVSITSTGDLTGEPVSANFTTGGTATFTGLVHTTAGTGLTLQATSNVFGSNTATSEEFDITEIVYVNGDFMTENSGTWNINGTGTATWLKRISGAFQPTSEIPNGPSGAYTVYITKDVTVPNIGSSGNFATAKLHITNNAKLTYSWTSSQFTFRNIIIDNGATLDMVGRFTILSTGNFEIKDGGNFIYSNPSINASSDSGTNMSSTLWNGNEVFHPNSNFIVGNHNTGNGNYFLPKASVLTPQTYNGVKAYFGNLIIDASVNEIRLTATNLSDATANPIYLTHGNLQYNPKGTSTSNLFYGSGTWTIGKDLVINTNTNNSPGTGYLSNIVGGTASGLNVSLNVKGNVRVNNPNTLTLSNSTTSWTVNLNVDKDVILTNGAILNVRGNTGTNTLNIKGNLTVDENSMIRSQSQGFLVFNGTGNGSSDTQTQYIDVLSNGATRTQSLTMTVNSGAYAKLKNNFALGSNSTLTVNGTFEADNKTISGTSGNKVTVENGGLFRTANDYGFSNDDDASIATTVANIDLKNGSTVEYNASGDQLISAQANVGQGTEGNYYNLKVSGSGIKAPADNLEVNDKITVNAGELKIKSTQDNITSTDHHVPNVLWAHKGIINNGGIVTLENNAQLMQDDSGVANSGVVNVQRKNTIPNSAFAQYVYWSSPVVPASNEVDKFFTKIFPGYTAAATYYSETNDHFYASSGKYIVGRGLAVKNPVYGTPPSPNFVMAELKGTPFNGPATFSMTMTGRGFNLVGNPYPTNLSLQQLYLLNGGDATATSEGGTIDPTFHLWDNVNNPDDVQEGSAYGGASYAIFNAKGTGTFTPANSSIKTFDGAVVSIGQGFMVKAIKADNKILMFNNTVRKPEKGIFFKSAVSNIDLGKYWLRLTNASSGFSTIAVTYSQGASNALESFDSNVANRGGDMFYSYVNDNKLAIQGRAYDFTTSDVVPLGMAHSQEGNYTISVWKKQGIFDGQQKIYLRDKNLGIVTDITAESYNFQSTSGEFTNRFEIVYEPQTTLGTTGATKGDIVVYRDGNDFVIKSSLVNIQEVELYEVSGKLTRELHGNAKELRFPTSKLANGVYFLKIRLENGSVVTRKIIQ